MPPQPQREVKITPPNENGYSKISIREGEAYLEGVVDSQKSEVVEPSSNLLVTELTGNMALVQFGRKFLFVPLDQGLVTAEDLDSVDGFQYAEPYRCGLALVMLDDAWFYINEDGSRAFEESFEFAESFHHDRALVKSKEGYRILNTTGNTVANLDFDQVNLQSPWCWQVTRIEKGKFLSGFVDLEGKPITELIYENVGYYDPDVKRIRVSQNGLSGFVDERAKVVIPVKYEYAEVFDRGKARVVLDGRTFFINPDGMEVPD